MRKVGICSAKVWFLWCESVVFVVRKYGFCGAKVWYLWCKSMVFVVRKYGFWWVYVCILQFVCSVVADRQQHYRNPLAAVGSDLSCPHIREHTRNGEGKCVCGEMNAGIWRIGYVYLVMWKHIFDDARIRAR